MAGTKMIKCVVPISGGKDSQACLKLALQKFDKSEVLGLFCDTKFEHPLTYAHVDKISEMYDIRIEKLNNGDVISLVRKYKRFPSDAARFCTDELKIKVGKEFYKKLAQEQGQGFEVWYGMRKAESSQREKRYAGTICDDIYPPHLFMPSKYPQYLEKLGVMIRLPIVDWQAEDVFEFLDGEQSPLYSMGFDRVGCFPCLAGGDYWKAKAFAFDDFGKSQRIKVVQLGHEIKKNVFTSLKWSLRNLDAIAVNKNSKQMNDDDLFDSPCLMCHI
jgi:3'-phosphoadenosine 5'-phosphosulfate sulfotransferase (PAPS reductase)/FAD synthetase